MKWWWFLIIFLTAVVQTTFLKYFEIGGVTPNILFVLAVIAIIFYGFEKSWAYLIFIGLILDFFSDFRFGVNLTALAVVAAFFHFFVRGFLNRKSAPACLFFGFLILLFLHFFSVGLNGFFIKLEGLQAAIFSRSFAFFSFVGVIYDFLIFVLTLFLLRFKFNVE